MIFRTICRIFQFAFSLFLIGLIPSGLLAQFELSEIHYDVFEKVNTDWAASGSCTLRLEEKDAWFSKDSSKECTWIDQSNFEQRFILEFQGMRAAIAPDRNETGALDISWTGEQKSVMGFDCHQLLANWDNFQMEAWVYKDTRHGYIPYLNRQGIALEYIFKSEGQLDKKYVAETFVALPIAWQPKDSIALYPSMTMQEFNVQMMEMMMPKLSHAPSFDHIDLAGQAVGINGTPERLLVLNFWYTQCPPCIKEIPDLNAIKTKYADEAVDFWAITFNDLELVQSFLNNHPFSYRIIPAASQVVADFNIRVYPTNMVVNQKGEIIKSFIGGDENTLRELDAFIQQALHLQNGGKSK